jgi:hypothetical protein
LPASVLRCLEKKTGKKLRKTQKKMVKRVDNSSIPRYNRYRKREQKGGLEMTITAKYPGKCKKCGGRINVGDKIEWTKGEGAAHVECPANPEPYRPEPRKMVSRFDSTCVECGLKIKAGEDIYYLKGKGAWHVDCSQAKEQERKERQMAPYQISVGEGYGGSPFTPGQVIEAPEYLQEKGIEYLTVVKATETYFPFDGMSFGVGDESGYLYQADCREATPEEAAPLKEKKRKIEEKKAAATELEEIKTTIKKNGERPVGNYILDGEVVCEQGQHTKIFGGGSWFVIEKNVIWYIENNGGDGDNWELNNVRTGGAGAIGWRVPFDETLAGRLRKIDLILAK